MHRFLLLPLKGNVKERQFDIDYFKRFDCVLNGLDNLEARRHVNRLCLAAGVPLVESGTAGYLGQVCRGEQEWVEGSRQAHTLFNEKQHVCGACI